MAIPGPPLRGSPGRAGHGIGPPDRASLASRIEPTTSYPSPTWLASWLLRVICSTIVREDVVAPVKFELKFVSIFYIVMLPVGITVGTLLGIFLKLHWVVALAGSTGGMIVGEVALGQGLFSRVELTRDGVILSSPFRRATVARGDVANMTLWLRSPNEETKPLWNQAAVLHITLRNGRRIDLGTMGVRITRSIQSHLATTPGPV